MRIVKTFNPVTKKVGEETVTEKQKVRVRYDRTELDSMFCPDFTHVFRVVDSHNYVIKCKNCPLHKHIQPGTEYIDKDGHVRLRSNDTVIA